MGTTRRRVTTLFTIVGIVTMAVVLLVGVAATCTCISRDDVPSRTILELHLDRPLVSPGVDDPFAMLGGGPQTTWLQVVDALQRGAHDERVVGVIAYLDGTPHGMAQIEELRDAVAAFRAAGKPAIAFSETLGELGPGNQGYYLAAAFDEVYLQPTGAVGLSGLRGEQMFLRGTFDKLGLEPQGGRRSEYKSAYDQLVERRMSEAAREQVTVLLHDVHDQIAAAVGARLGADATRGAEVIAAGPYLATEALELGLVDGLAYRDEALEILQQRVGGEAERLYPGPYLERADSTWAEGRVIAVVHGEGGISRGPNRFDPIGGSPSMGAESIVAAFRAATDDPDVEAIVFRVNSPGGSAVASDAIWRATQRAREAGKPVVVSMGNVAASGGYYVSAGADRIVAHPSTITGSIGVVAIKTITRGLWNKVGVTWDSAQTSPNAAFWSDLEGYDADGREQLSTWLDRIYADFKQRVSDGRGMTAERVEQVARGRVWSGRRAKEEGLVDALGGLTTAIALARAQAGIGDDEAIELRTFPEHEGLVARALAGPPDNSDAAQARARVDASLQQWRDVAAQLGAAGQVTGESGVLMTTPIQIE